MARVFVQTAPNSDGAYSSFQTGLLGDGSFGSVTISGDTTLTRTSFYSALTVNSAIKLSPAGYLIFCTGEVTNNGTISVAGSQGGATGGSGGSGGGFAVVGGGRTGGAGVLNGVGGAGVASGYTTDDGTTYHKGGAGGAGGGFGAGAAGGCTRGAHIPRSFLAWFGALTDNTGATTRLQGGSGGGAGGAGDAGTTGAGGGGGGGVLVILCDYFNNGSGTAVTAVGGAGGNATGTNCGGGGGGGAGIIFIGARQYALGANPPTVAGSNGGTGNGTGAGGIAGQAGLYIQVTF